MLELPEVEVLRRDLEKEVVGKRVKDVIIETPSITKPFHRTRPELQKALEERKIEGARRRGAVIFLDLDEDVTWVIDPGGTSSLHRETANEPPGDDTHMVVTFTIGGAIHISDPNSDPSASTGVVPTESAFEEAGLDPKALDPLDDNPTWMEFASMLREAATDLRSFLTDNKHIVGIGDVYGDEILWEAGLRHDRPTDQISTQEVRRLYRAIQEVLAAAMKERDSSLDQVDHEVAVDDEGEVAEHLKVYGREGLPCLRCRQPIVHTKIKRGSYTYHCEQCMI
ncbi:MAG: DNA-formamidopyrimidine glycosylase family protein [Nitriliruptorales bacterium]|nr:DNA-formamidopyrimidine glycosylase family protein [Nitriliruptorales bacterium]